MSELVLDSAEMSAVATAMSQAGMGMCVLRPGVGTCGSTEVIEAFAQTFTILYDQQSNVAISWTTLGTRGRDAISAMERADAALAGAGL